MRAVNAVRLALGTRLDVGEEPMERVDPERPRATCDKLVYEVLNTVLARLHPGHSPVLGARPGADRRADGVSGEAAMAGR